MVVFWLATLYIVFGPASRFQIKVLEADSTELVSN